MKSEVRMFLATLETMLENITAASVKEYREIMDHQEKTILELGRMGELDTDQTGYYFRSIRNIEERRIRTE